MGMAGAGITFTYYIEYTPLHGHTHRPTETPAWPPQSRSRSGRRGPRALDLLLATKHVPGRAGRDMVDMPGENIRVARAGARGRRTTINSRCELIFIIKRDSDFWNRFSEIARYAA